MAHISQIWRHPIKAHGREQIESAVLTKGRALPFDRQWAISHQAAKFDNGSDVNWHPCRNFTRGAGAPLLQAMTATFDTATQQLTLIHPSLPSFTFNPDNAAETPAFITWVSGLIPAGRPQPTGIVKAQNSMTDSETVSLSLINLASHAEIEQRVGRELSPLRWRGNILVSDLPAWSERDLVGKHIRIGTAEFYIRKEITRCRMTEASTRTGERDADTLGALRDGWNHQEMGVQAVVTKSGQIQTNDKIEVLG